MELLLQREPTQLEVTYGKIQVDGLYECESLEDAIRELPREHGESLGDWFARWKVPANTCIPAARYKIEIDVSRRFHRIMPHLRSEILNEQEAITDDRRGFAGIRIHALNTIEQTRGCIGTGRERINFGTAADPKPGIGMAGQAFSRLFESLKLAIGAGESVYIDVRNP